MKILILYGTTEGQTARIAGFLGDRLRASGHAVLVADSAADAQPDPAGFDAAILAASLHAGSYQDSVAAYARRHRARLAAMPSAFVSVSLSAAGTDPGDLKGLAACVAAFELRTGWHPDRLHHAAGAFRFTRYGLLKRWAMRWVAWRRGQSIDATRDRELTDWEALAGFADRFATDAAQARQ
ncbi:MAG TPA: flavodoxin domain-containing protein [Azospirillaceae bacterium]|nr:flavodoxin domain-containing protein [Azospirillaceae bacterium]